MFEILLFYSFWKCILVAPLFLDWLYHIFLPSDLSVGSSRHVDGWVRHSLFNNRKTSSAEDNCIVCCSCCTLQMSIRLALTVTLCDLCQGRCTCTRANPPLSSTLYRFSLRAWETANRKIFFLSQYICFISCLFLRDGPIRDRKSSTTCAFPRKPLGL